MQYKKENDDRHEMAFRIAYLIAAASLGILSVQQQEELDDWLSAHSANADLFDELTQSSAAREFLISKLN